MYLRPGTLVNCLVISNTNSGIIVKFLKCCYGFILLDHLLEGIEIYHKNKHLQARIIYFGMNPPTAYLS